MSCTRSGAVSHCCACIPCSAARARARQFCACGTGIGAGAKPGARLQRGAVAAHGVQALVEIRAKVLRAHQLAQPERVQVPDDHLGLNLQPAAASPLAARAERSCGGSQTVLIWWWSVCCSHRFGMMQGHTGNLCHKHNCKQLRI
jgi:hypothetical protein